jgi:hypothetical protein
MELFLFTGTLASILANDVVWKMPPHETSEETEAFLKHCEYLQKKDLAERTNQA